MAAHRYQWTLKVCTFFVGTVLKLLLGHQGPQQLERVMFRVSGCVFPLALGFHLVEPHQPAHSPHLMAIQLAVFKTGSLNESLPQHLLTSVSASPFMFYEKSLHFCFANFAVSYVSSFLWIIYSRSQFRLFISVHSQSRPTEWVEPQPIPRDPCELHARTNSVYIMHASLRHYH